MSHTLRLFERLECRLPFLTFMKYVLFKILQREEGLRRDRNDISNQCFFSIRLSLLSIVIFKMQTYLNGSCG